MIDAGVDMLRDLFAVESEDRELNVSVPCLGAGAPLRGNA
jgi:hypothetical protein